MKIVQANKEDLDLHSATGGFYVDTGDPATFMFFHWVRDNEPGTHYDEVLTVFPDRLAAIGLEDEAGPLLGEVIGMFGAGQEKTRRGK